jgi:homoserine O-acetyltransferase
MPRTTQQCRVHDITLECGVTLPYVDVAYHLDGALDADRANVVLVHHALTGSADAVGDWWRDVIGPGRAVDTRRYAVLSTNLLGSCYGTRAPWHDRGEAPPRITTRDQARVAHAVADALDIQRIALACGGSLGGMVAFESMATFGDRVDAAVVFAAPARQTALGAAWGACMRRALDIGGDTHGLALARMIGMVSYRTSESLENKSPGGAHHPFAEWPVSQWLSAHGEKLVARFDATSYRTLVDAMDTHDIARGREREALAHVAARTLCVGIPGDLLYPAEDVWQWAHGAGARTVAIESIHGHDAFLLEEDQVSSILADALRRVEAQRSARQVIHTPSTSTTVDTTTRNLDSGILRNSASPASVPHTAPAVATSRTGHSRASSPGIRVR